MEGKTADEVSQSRLSDATLSGRTSIDCGGNMEKNVGKKKGRPVNNNTGFVRQT